MLDGDVAATVVELKAVLDVATSTRQCRSVNQNSSHLFQSTFWMLNSGRSLANRNVQGEFRPEMG